VIKDPDTGLWLPEERGIVIGVNVELELWRDGDLLDIVQFHNAQTATFRNMVVDQLLASPTLAKTTYMAVGTGAPAANALGAESARVALSTKSRTTNVLTMSADFPPGTATATLTEAGTFDAAAAGNMHHSGTFGALTKDAAMDLVINWTYTLN
jgi:hypothetical protein